MTITPEMLWQRAACGDMIKFGSRPRDGWLPRSEWAEQAWGMAGEYEAFLSERDRTTLLKATKQLIRRGITPAVARELCDHQLLSVHNVGRRSVWLLRDFLDTLD